MNKLVVALIILISLILVVSAVRIISPSEIDDVSPEINCHEIEKYNPDVLWIIPKFNNISISENQNWCNYILDLNKTLGMHGVTHEFNEFDFDRDKEYIQNGIQIFEQCFGKKPKMFKPPQIEITQKNKQLVKNNNLELKTSFNQVFHKVYHCNDSDNVRNWIIHLI